MKRLTVRMLLGRGVAVSVASLSLSGSWGCGSATPTTGPEETGDQMGAPVDVILLRGSFHDVVASGRGTAEILQAPDGTRSLRLSAFETDAAPQLEVYMVAASDATDSQSVIDAGYVTLGPLKSASGDQTYSIPADLDLDEYRAVTIWCVAFVVNFATAPLTPFGT